LNLRLNYLPKNGEALELKRVKSFSEIMNYYRELLTRLNLVHLSLVWSTPSTRFTVLRKLESF